MVSCISSQTPYLYNTILNAWKVFPNAAPTVSALPAVGLNPHVLPSVRYLKDIQIIDFRLCSIRKTWLSYGSS